MTANHHLGISESLLDILDLFLKIFFSLSILIACIVGLCTFSFATLRLLPGNYFTLIRKTFHGLVHPSQLGLQHGNLKIVKLSVIIDVASMHCHVDQMEEDVDNNCDKEEEYIKNNCR